MPRRNGSPRGLAARQPDESGGGSDGPSANRSRSTEPTPANARALRRRGARRRRMRRTDGVVIGGRPLSHRAAVGEPGELFAVGLGGPERRGLHRASSDHQLLHLGRPGRDQEPAGGRRRLPRGQPEDHGQGHRVGLGHVLGQAPDRDRRRRCAGRLRDGRPPLPGLPVTRRPPGPQAVHRSGRLRPQPTRRPGRRRLQDAGRSVRRTARPQCRRPLLQQGDVRRRWRAVPGRQLGLGEARRGRPQADDRREPRRQTRPVGFLHGDERHGELLVVARLAERRRDPRARWQVDRPGF